jgi:ABC-type transport system substrate-binding protein
VQALLQAVGIEVQIESLPATDVATKKRNGDFELATHGFSISDDDYGIVKNVIGVFSSKSASNRMAYKSTEMDSALAQLQVADTDAKRTDALRQVASIYTRDVPFLALEAVEERPSWSSSVHGIKQGLQTELYFDKAWMKQ